MNTFIKNRRLSFIANNSGMLLIEVIISAGIAGILMLSLLAMMQLVNQNSSRVSLGVTKNEIINRIRVSAVSLTSIESSANLTETLGTDGLTPDIGTANNLVNFQALKDCLPSSGTAGTCNKSSMDDARGFRFYLANGSSTDPTKALAGEDVYYTISGIRCDQTKAVSASECPIMAQAWAEPFCSGFATSCNKAISLTIRYRISLRPDFTGTALMAPIEGEVYLPLTKGIQLSRLLSQNDSPLTMNSSGIYTVQKYYGLTDQINTLQPTGLRFEAILGNPTGLLTMRLQYRAITGTAAATYLDDSVPSSLTSASWVDLPDPSTGTGQWTVAFSSAKPNQIINFGTQASTNAPNTISKNWKIGATTSESAAEQAKYRWTYNGLGQLVAPTLLQSGFYQFRVLATDSNSTTIESMNYITLRLVSRPQFLTPPGQPSLDQTRNCISAQKDINYSMTIADDESVGAQTLKLNGVDASFTPVSGTSGTITLPFDLSQVITGTSQTFIYHFTAQNNFTGRSVNNVTLANSSTDLSVRLSEKEAKIGDLSANPSKIRINTTGIVSATMTSGSCCNETPSVAWSYLSIPEASAALLSGNATSAASCSIDNTTNTRTCLASVTATGIVESPTSTSSKDIASTFTYSTPGTACTGGTTQTAFSNALYVPVVKIPGIQFYITESLWLDLPDSGIANSLKSITPTVYVRADFQPDQDVIVGVYKASNNELVCSLTFNAGTGTNPIDKDCIITGAYSGDLLLRRISTNVMIDTDTPDPSYRAKLVSGKLNHRTCRANITNISDFSNYTVSYNQPMTNSPWGYDLNTLAQYPQNDTGNWNTGDVKTLRCYDNWSGTITSGGNSSGYSSSDSLYIRNMGLFAAGYYEMNIQDTYKLVRYNSEPSLRYSAYYPQHHIALGSNGGGRARYQTYIFPDNPNLDFDPKNAPYVFVVWVNGAPSNAIWQYINPGGANSSTPQKSWTNYTDQVCQGSSALSTIKLYGIKTTGHSTVETVMKATNNIYTNTGSGYYSYNFMCAFGRWNPYNKTQTNWTH